jgi:mannose-1-phosphate guanylyltransferase
MRTVRSDLWAIILAGGAGTRLAPLTRALYGVDLPKQYAVLAGGDSLLQATVARTSSLVPAERIVVVATAPHGETARAQLARWPGVKLIVQPYGLDTGPGLLLPLAAVLAHDPAAHVLIQPADHHFTRPEALVRTLRRAVATGTSSRGSLTLVGAPAEAPDTEYGWIVPSRRIRRDGRRAIEGFVEKPDLASAEALHGSGALWNTFIMTGRGDRLWQVAAAGLPEHAERIAAVLREVKSPSPSQVAEAFAGLSPANFSRDVLEHAAGLEVVAMPDAGWSDWGTPRRVFASLQGTAAHACLVRRLQGTTRSTTATSAVA